MLTNTFFWLFVVANFVSAVGTYMFTTGVSWIMTEELDASPILVALVQTANFLPMVLLVLVAGAVGELFDQQKTLIATQVFLVISVLAFAYLAYQEQFSPVIVLVFTFVNGIAAAFARPILAALVPQIVEGREQLRRAIDINAVFFNVSRALGPILGGWLISAYTLDLPFWINAATFLAVIGVMLFWKDKRHEGREIPREPLRFAMGDTVRFARHTPALYDSIFRAVIFFVSAGALYTLLPLLAKDKLDGDATTYGIMLGGTGLGALSVVLFTDRITEWLGANRLTVYASLGLAAALAGLGVVPDEYWGTGLTFLAGICWQLAYTAIMTSAQTSLPDWYQSRGMSLFMMTMSLGIGLGSILWGILAEFGSISLSFFVSAGLAAGGAFLGRRFELDQSEGVDLDAAGDVPEPPDYLKIDDDEPDGQRPVLVEVHYHLGEADAKEAIRKINALEGPRYRNGAREWHLVRDPEDDSRLIENFYGLSVAQYLRQQQRIIGEDFENEQELREWLEQAGGSVERKVFLRAEQPEAA